MDTFIGSEVIVKHILFTCMLFGQDVLCLSSVHDVGYLFSCHLNQAV